MNKKIKDLAKQAGFDLPVAEGAFNGHILPNSLERFASNIIKECLDNLYINGYDDAAEQLKLHFGD
jgi:hypothetical protein